MLNRGLEFSNFKSLRKSPFLLPDHSIRKHSSLEALESRTRSCDWRRSLERGFVIGRQRPLPGVRGNRPNADGDVGVDDDDGDGDGDAATDGLQEQREVALAE